MEEWDTCAQFQIKIANK